MDLVMAPFLHPREGLGKARDGLAGEHRDRTLASARIEHLPVVEAAFIIDQHAILRSYQRAAAGSDRFDLDRAAANRLSADPGESDAGADDDQESEPQLDRPASMGGTVSGFGYGHAFVGG